MSSPAPNLLSRTAKAAFFFMNTLAPEAAATCWMRPYRAGGNSEHVNPALSGSHARIRPVGGQADPFRDPSQLADPIAGLLGDLRTRIASITEQVGLPQCVIRVLDR